MIPLLRGAIPGVVLFAALSGCRDGDPPPLLPDPPGPPATVVAVSDTSARAEVGTELANPLVVRVTDSAGRPVPDVEVAWKVSADGGIVDPASSRTDASGQAQTRWTLPSKLGSHVATAVVADLPPARFRATAGPGPVARLVPVDTVRTTMVRRESPLFVLAYDRHGNRIRDAQLTWRSSDTSVVAVSEAGVLRGVRVGRTVVTASAGASTAAVRIEVREYHNDVTSSGIPEEAVVVVGYDAAPRIAFSVPFATLSPESVTWSVSDPDVLRVDRAGRVTAVGEGRALVVAVVSGITYLVPYEVRRVRFASVSVGGTSACALTTDREALCWGASYRGQLGTTTALVGIMHSMVWEPSAAPRFVTPDSLRFTQVAVGEEHACALTPGGEPYCWGVEHALGQRLLLPRECRQSPRVFGVPCSFTALKVPGISGATQLSAGESGSCTLTAGRSLHCWGRSVSPDLSDGLSVAQVVGSPPSSIDPSWAPGARHWCVLDTGGRLHCAGENSRGQLGSGTRTSSAALVPVAGEHRFRSAALGWRHTCAVTVGDELYCWGDNLNGQLGLGTSDTLPHPRPERVEAGGPVSAVTAGRLHTCALAAGESAYCWGGDGITLGLGGSAELERCIGGASCSTKPARVAGGHAWRVIDAGEAGTCGITTAGLLYCWGSVSRGYLPPQATPTLVPGQH